MKWTFKVVKNIDDIEIEIRSFQFDKRVRDIIDTIEEYDKRQTKDTIFVNDGDRTFLVKVVDIISIEVENREIVIETINRTYRSHGSLSTLINEIGKQCLVQVF